MSPAWAQKSLVEPDPTDNADLKKIEDAPPQAQDTVSSEAATDVRVQKIVPALSIKDADGHYVLTVTNRAKLPRGLFTRAPYLPPAGENAAASRSWIYVRGAGGAPYETLVSLDSVDNLSALELKHDLYPAGGATIKLDIWDRQTDEHYISEPIELPHK